MLTEPTASAELMAPGRAGQGPERRRAVAAAPRGERRRGGATQ